MSYDIESHRRGELEHDLHLVRDGGPGWHCYVLAKAESLVKQDPIVHGGLVAANEGEIGPKATRAARSALAWFSNPKHAR